MKPKNGTLINRYKIISSIGKGGMGEVFLPKIRNSSAKFANPSHGRVVIENGEHKGKQGVFEARNLCGDVAPVCN